MLLLFKILHIMRFRYKSTLIIGFLLVLNNPLFAMVIDLPGEVQLGGNLIDTGVDLITITTNNVILDLGEHAIAGGINGIKINEGLSNIIIRNGAISNVTNAGISIDQNCSSITLQKLKLKNCITRGIEILGTSTINAVTELTIEGLRIESCALSPLSDSVVFMSYVTNLMLLSIQLVNNGNALANISLLKFNECTDCLAQVIFALTNHGNSMNGAEYTNPVNCVIRDSIIANNVAMTGDLIGVKLMGTSIGNAFRHLAIFNNTAGGQSCGLDLGDNSVSTIVSDCQIVELTGGSSFGYAVHGSNSVKNVIGRSSALNLEATDTNGISAGFYIDGANAGTIAECVSSYNFAPAGTAYGIFFNTTNGGANWNINENKIVRNQGSNDSNSFGIYASSGTNNLFIKNFAYDNGLTAGNQMLGVPFGSVSQLNTNNINNAPSAWSNIVIVP